MKYIDEFRSKELVKILIDQINQVSAHKIRLMEVCGGHTMAIQRFGIPSLLPDTVALISGPGCPVCVTAIEFIDHSLALAQREDIIIATYGDLLKVPGTNTNLQSAKAGGADIRMVQSSLAALNLSLQHPDRKVVFLGIGFETTAPATAIALIKAEQMQLKNFYVLSAHKVMPPAMQALIDEEVQLDGYIGPGHVSSITGTDIYQFIAQKYHIPVVIAGFEPVDLLQAILMLIKQFEAGEARVENQYSRGVRSEGNQKARQFLNQVFQLQDDYWRGLGIIARSGLKIKPSYQQFDAGQLDIKPFVSHEPKGCICGKILKGIKNPVECILFGNQCMPEHPIGACMVSHEGACQAHYRYRYQ
ncbi:MAG: hydrogenase formation protein HypD [Candidatus Cyclobacteriaceae bacterium M3_2C_046]